MSWGTSKITHAVVMGLVLLTFARRASLFQGDQAGHVPSLPAPAAPRAREMQESLANGLNFIQAWSAGLHTKITGRSGGGKRIGDKFPTATAQHMAAFEKVVAGSTELVTNGKWSRAIEGMRATHGGLMIVSDFDHTLTTFYVGPNGEKSNQCHDIIFEHASDSPEWAASVEGLWRETQAKFGDPNQLSPEHKEAYYIWWWTDANRRMIEQGITREQLRRAVERASIRLRPGFKELVAKCAERGVPVLIVSAGISDVIEEVLTREGIDHSGRGVRVLANRMRFDAGGTLVGFEEREGLVHSGNKHRTAEIMRDYFSEHFQSGINKLIILGDKVNDLRAGHGLEDKCNGSLRVGFARGEETELLEHYHAVVPNDGPLYPVMQLVDDVLITAPLPTAPLPS